MNYKFNLDFITKQFAVDNEIKLYKNTNLIDKFYFEVFSNLNPRKLIMTFRGFDKVINFNIFLKNNLNENGIAIKDIFTGVFTVDKRMTKEVFTSYLIFEILDDMNNSIGTSTRIPIKIVNSMITDDCGGQIGIIDHRNLQGREYPEQHPANSIVGAKEETVEEDLIKLYDNLEENKEEFLNQIDILNQNLENEINILSDSINLVEKDLTEEILKVEKESKERDTTLQENINNEEKIRQQNDKILNDKISVENRERINEDRILGERIDDLTQSTNDNFENIKNDFDEKLEKEKQERIAEDLKLENKKINITQIGNTVAPLGKDNLIPRNFLPETLFKSFKYFENIIDRDSSSPIDDDWCYVNETTKFYVFKEDNWKPITLLEVIVDAINITFNNQDTIFTGSNVQIVIQEISNLFKENNLNLENIIKDIEKLKEDLKNEIQARKDEDKKIIDDLKIVKLDFENYKNETNIVTNDLTSSLGNLENLKLDKTVFENYKNETNIVTNDLTSTIGNLETDLNQKISEKVDETKFEATLKNYVKEIKIKDDILTTDNSLIDLTDKIKSFVTAVTLELGTSDQIQLLLDKLEEHINSDEPHNIIKIKLEELQTNLINFKDLLLQQITTEISDHNNSETAHSDLFNKLKDEINLILDDLKTELLEEINQIKLDIVDIQTAIETINQKFEDLDGVVSGSIDDIDIKITNHNNSETAHPFIQNKITNLNSRVDKLEPKAIFISQNSIQDFIDNNPEANKIQSGNLIIFKNAEEQVEIYQFFTTSSIVETKTSDGWDNIDNYVPLQQEIKLQNASTTDIGVVGIGNNINIDSNGFIYLDDASETGKGLVQLGTLEELEKSSTTKVFTGKIIKDYFLSKIPVSATNADVATGTDNAKYITPATLPIKSVTTGNGLTLNNKVLAFDQSKLQFAEEKTYLEFQELIRNNQLIAGKNYIIKDYRLEYTIPRITGINTDDKISLESEIAYGEPERFLVTAKNTNEIIPFAYSLTYEYEWVILENEKFKPKEKLWIKRRVDTSYKSIDICFDYRNIKTNTYRIVGFDIPAVNGELDSAKLYQANNILYRVKNGHKILTDIKKDLMAVGSANLFLPIMFIEKFKIKNYSTPTKKYIIGISNSEENNLGMNMGGTSSTPETEIKNCRYDKIYIQTKVNGSSTFRLFQIQSSGFFCCIGEFQNFKCYDYSSFYGIATKSVSRFGIYSNSTVEFYNNGDAAWVVENKFHNVECLIWHNKDIMYRNNFQNMTYENLENIKYSNITGGQSYSPVDYTNLDGVTILRNNGSSYSNISNKLLPQSDLTRNIGENEEIKELDGVELIPVDIDFLKREEQRYNLEPTEPNIE